MQLPAPKMQIEHSKITGRSAASDRLRPGSTGRAAATQPAFPRRLTVACNEYQPGKWLRHVGAGLAAALLSLQAVTAAPLARAGVAPPLTASPLAPRMITPEALRDLLPLPTEFPPLPPLRLPKYRYTHLKNGLRVVLLEDHEAPLVRGVMLMRGGQRASPPHKVGLASIAAAVQRAGGSVAHPEAALDSELEELAASIEGGAGPETISMGFECLAEDAPRVMELFSEVILTPAVPPGKLELFRSQALNALVHRNDNPGAIPGREVAKLIYGKDSLWAQQPTVGQIMSFTPADVAAWLAEWERPDAAVLGVVGDFRDGDMASLVEQRLGAWQPPAGAGAPRALPSHPLPDQSAVRGRVFLVDRPGATQASVAAGEVGIQMMDGDECGLDVLGDLLNSFGGALFDGIRSRGGLAYSVSGGWDAPVDHPGLFLASAETAQPAALLVALRRALSAAEAEAPAAAELERAKEESLNSSVFEYASNTGQLRRAIAFELLGIPQDYPFTYRARLAKVTAADVQAAAKRHLHPQQQVTVVVGDARAVRQSLEAALGVTVEPLQLD